jgi:DNA mismatch endonuclease, patch repair protein
MARLPPTPAPTSAAATATMKANRRKDTAPELAVRRILHAAGLRYRVDLPIRLGDGGRVRPDVVFTRRRLCLFVDGCYWHGCERHCRVPTANRAYWRAKIDRNRARDAATTDALKVAGWTVIRAWEHDAPADIVANVIVALRIDEGAR